MPAPTAIDQTARPRKARSLSDGSVIARNESTRKDTDRNRMDVEGIRRLLENEPTARHEPAGRLPAVWKGIVRLS
jgi:hypothetical protein